jgi:hypothetical protein
MIEEIALRRTGSKVQMEQWLADAAANDCGGER